MKSIKILCFILILAISMLNVVSASDMFSVKTSLNTFKPQESYGISVASGEILEFSAEDLEMRLGISSDSLGGITVTSVPPPSSGELLLEGVPVESFEFIPREMLDSLCFVPAEKAVAASISFIPRAEKTGATELTIDVLQSENLPASIQSTSYNTVSNMPLSGHISASDPENDELEIRVLTPPVNGTVKFDGLNFRYTPYKNISGKDSFTVCAVDAANNYSNKATIFINIERQRVKFFYTDMQTHPSAYAAVKLHEHRVVTGSQIGGNYFFEPDNGTTRGEFLVMLISASGLEKSMKPTVNTGLPNDNEIPYWMKPYVKKAIEANIWSATQPFLYYDIPSRAEAVVLTDRTSKINDVKDFSLEMLDADNIPYWAVESYKNLAAYKMLDLHDNIAYPAEYLTNSYSADLVWQLWKHYNL